jgi:hypothetical protein
VIWESFSPDHRRCVVAKRETYSSCSFSCCIVIACMMGDIRDEFPDVSRSRAQEVHKGDQVLECPPDF